MKNRTLILFVLICISWNSFSQEIDIQVDKKNVDELISELNWNSFGFIYNYSTSLGWDEYAQRLEELGKDISPKLLEAIKDTEKAVIVHMILTKLWEPEVYFWKENDIEFEDLYFTEWSLNNLSWITQDKKTPSIDEFEQERIYKYWTKRINECK